MSDSEAYRQKKKNLSSIFTIYGRKPVLEALNDPSLKATRLHLADTNKAGGILKDIQEKAKTRKLETNYHSRQALARISKNGKQDQGVALDIHLTGFSDYQDFLANNLKASVSLSGNFIALDKVTNPQNLGMIIRTVCASPAEAILLPRKGCAKLDALVIKASAGTLFKAQILWCDELSEALLEFKKAGASIIGLKSDTKESLWGMSGKTSKVYILGNETEGLSEETLATCDQLISIPMNNDVESLNVAVTAGIIAFQCDQNKQ